MSIMCLARKNNYSGNKDLIYYLKFLSNINSIKADEYMIIHNDIIFSSNNYFSQLLSDNNYKVVLLLVNTYNNIFEIINNIINNKYNDDIIRDNIMIKQLNKYLFQSINGLHNIKKICENETIATEAVETIIKNTFATLDLMKKSNKF